MSGAYRWEGRCGSRLASRWMTCGPYRGRSRSPSTTACKVGPSGIGKWAGALLTDILERCEPLPEARFVLCTSYGLDQFTSGGQPRRPFYEVIDLELARRPHTILAYALSDQPLSLPYGAPLRLRVEAQLGYEMVKYLRSIELIAKYQPVGDGQGGSREDTMVYGRGAVI